MCLCVEIDRAKTGQGRAYNESKKTLQNEDEVAQLLTLPYLSLWAVFLPTNCNQIMSPNSVMYLSTYLYAVQVKICLVGKYTSLNDAYLSVIKSLQHASLKIGRKLILDVRGSSKRKADKWRV